MGLTVEQQMAVGQFAAAQKTWTDQLDLIDSQSNGVEEAAKVKAAGKAWYKTMISDSDYTEFENFTKWLGVTQ
ncbi:unnamed protein product [Miscanthus lutarioriparius]|uniref:Uncharacterized protein n=1 Tax=Miscanthus lutarioriparius TaxID=422564 RepID=A0A811RRW1_9POAL|nr:unnamed protein product [Miscanthus lutarioriparius]